MRAVVYRGPNDLRLEKVPVPRIGSNELLVKVAVCGVCPTDIKKIQYGTLPPPRIFGHETAGVIVRRGAQVRRFQVGERVALHHHVPCLKCHDCAHRAFSQCAQYKRTGITAGFEPAGGGYAEYVRVMPWVLPGVVKIPQRNSFFEGAMLEPVNTVLKAVKRLALLRGDTVLVAGQGPIGLMFTRLLALQGMKVVATDRLTSRLQLAREFGAKWTWEVASNPKSEDREAIAKVGLSGICSSVPPHPALSLGEREHHRQRIRQPEPLGVVAKRSMALPLPEGRGEGARALERAGGGSFAIGSRNPKFKVQSSRFKVSSLSQLTNHLTQSRGLDAAIIAVPSDEVVCEAQQLVRGGGQVLLFSHTRRGEHTSLDLATICADEKDLIGSYSADFTLQDEVARLVFSRKLDVRRLITHQFPLEQTAEAIALAARPADASLKVVVSQADK